MLTTYKNGFIQAIKNQQLDPVDFSVLENTSQYPPEVFKKSGLPVVTTIRFRDSGLRFEITDIPTTLHQFFANYTRFDAGCPLRRSGPGKPYLPIDRVYVLFSEWLMKELKPYIEEMKQPDLWQQIEQQKQLVSADPLTDCETSPFTEAEKQQVRVSIGQFRVLIVESFSPTQEQLEVINQRLDYLSGGVDRLSRFDWKALALAIVVGIGINLCVDAEGGRKLFELFRQAFSGVLHLLAGS